MYHIHLDSIRSHFANARKWKTKDHLSKQSWHHRIYQETVTLRTGPQNEWTNQNYYQMCIAGALGT